MYNNGKKVGGILTGTKLHNEEVRYIVIRWNKHSKTRIQQRNQRNSNINRTKFNINIR